jgi:hypothetical protein
MNKSSLSLGGKPLLLASNQEGAGLGNRMRFTLSALSLARAVGREFVYSWPKSQLFCSSLNQLWKFDEHEISWQESVEMENCFPSISRVSDLPVDHSLLPIWHFNSHNALNLPKNAVPWGRQLRSLSPVKEIADRIKYIFNQYLIGKPYIGIMIRTHSLAHPITQNASPLEWYLKRMSELKAANPDVKFFISSDTPQAQDKIIQMFPNSFAQIDKGQYNSTQGLVSSVVDLYLLASSSYMLSPYYSSFPTLALKLCNGVITNEHSCDNFQVYLDITKVPLVRDPLFPAKRFN